MRRSMLRRLIALVRPYRIFLWLALVTSLVGVFCSLWLPVLVGDTINLMVGVNQVAFSKMPIVLMLVVIAVGGVLQWVSARCLNRVAYGSVKDLRNAAFAKLNRLALRSIDAHPHGDYIARLSTDIELISDGLIQGFAQLFSGVLTILFTLIFMLMMNGTLTLVVVVITPVSLIAAALIAKYSHRSFLLQAKERGELAAYVDEMVGNQKLVKAFGYEERTQSVFEEINMRLYQSGRKSQFYASLTNPSTRFINALVYAAVGIVGALLSIGGTLSVGQIASFLIYANQYTKPFNEISGVVAELQTALASARRVFELLDDEGEERDRAGALVAADCAGSVELQDVTFSYRKGQRLLEHVQLAVQAGQRIAIVGPTGSGKTTLMNLLMRFYELEQGKILLDGSDIADFTLNSLRGQYGMVLQDTWLFEGTLHENIAYGRPDATREEVVAAAKAAHAHGFIQCLSQGYDTVIRSAQSLSEGQRQLVCIARVMLTNPSILLLDEATSSIDTRTEAFVQRAFDRMMQGRTSFVVAHRLSTIREADVILVMRDGNIVEQGTHDELMERGTYYAKLYRSQFEGAEV